MVAEILAGEPDTCLSESCAVIFMRATNMACYQYNWLFLLVIFTHF